MDVYEEAAEYRLVMDLPGVSREAIETASGPVAGTLVVRAQAREERKEEAKGPGAEPRHRVLRDERGSSSQPARFERVVPVAVDADTSRARVETRDGVATLIVPKKATKEERPRR
ncbi:MAG: Hsp20/alpha crystallin family protein [Thermoplasmatota archaeon]